ncbi:MAG: glycosyltransferase family 2 protein [Mycobacteriales bacterium]|nr:glycosyltransferase family 2 protein [Mycobacteriales bacterium]
MSKIRAAVLILTKNEEPVIARTLQSVADFDQIVVVDSGSKDRTEDIARGHGAEVVRFEWNGRYPKKKEWALLHAPLRHGWVLYLDADEVVTKELSEEIRHRLETADSLGIAAFDVTIDYHFMGRKLRHGHKVSKRVLVRRDKTQWPQVDDLGAVNMWEVEGHYQPVVEGRVDALKATMAHEDLDSLYDYFGRHNRYSDWEAHLLARPGAAEEVLRHRSVRAQRYARIPFRPFAFFVYAYLLRGGCFDGSAGFHYAVAQSFYLWQVGVKAKEFRRG